MSDLAHALKEAKRTPSRVPNHVERIMRRMRSEDPQALTEFQAAIEDVDRVSVRVLAKILNDAGYECSAATLHKYRVDHDIRPEQL